MTTPAPRSAPDPPDSGSGSDGDDTKAARSSQPWRWLVLALLLAAGPALFPLFTADAPPQLPYSRFYELVEGGQVAELTMNGRSLSGKFKEKQAVGEVQSETFRSRLPVLDDATLLPLLRKQEVALEVTDEAPSSWWSMAGAVLPWLLIMGGWWWLSRRARGMMGGEGKGMLDRILPKRSHRIEAQTVDVHFTDVAGLENAKRDLHETVEFLREPERFGRLGGKLPRGVLLTGAPGTGKTLLARAVAGEAQVPFYSLSASEFIEMFVGVGASRVRELFKQAKQTAPSIVFIDEIDAVGRARGTGMGGGNDEREQTLNQLLAEMDGFDRSDRIVVIAATNRPDVLDAALLRPGRFDRHVVVDLPHADARRAILELHTANKPLAKDVSLADLATATPGFSGAGLANLANEAALGAMRREADEVTAADFGAALDKVLLGDRREMVLSPTETKRVAIHEAGHAIVASFSPGAEALRRVSIIPRGRALGVTQQQPHERQLATRTELCAQLAVLMGGYAAELQRLGEVSSGSENDLKEANRLATKMVSQLGMSDELGPIHQDQAPEHPFLGARMASETSVSAALVHQIEQAAHGLIKEGLIQARTILQERNDAFERLVAALLRHETLDRDAIQHALAPDVAA